MLLGAQHRELVLDAGDPSGKVEGDGASEHVHPVDKAGVVGIRDGIANEEGCVEDEAVGDSDAAWIEEEVDEEEQVEEQRVKEDKDAGLALADAKGAEGEVGGVDAAVELRELALVVCGIFGLQRGQQGRAVLWTRRCPLQRRPLTRAYGIGSCKNSLS